MPTPVYPYQNYIAGLRGEVLFKVTIADNKIIDYSVIRSSNDLFREAAVAALARHLIAPGIPSGTYSFSIVFCAPGEEDPSRPGTFWVTIEGLR